MKNKIVIVPYFTVVCFMTIKCEPIAQEQNELRAARSRQANFLWTFPDSIPSVKEKIMEAQTEPESQVPKFNYNQCINIVRQKPNFSKPGRRISEAKCLEYLWDAKAAADNKKREYECDQYRAGTTLMEPKHHVLGGRVADPGEFPHMGAVGWKGVNGDWIFQCGASVISPKFMVTAAHCSKASSRDAKLANLVPEIVRIGAKDIDTKVYNANGDIVVFNYVQIYPKDVNIVTIINHPNYAPPKQYFDIALIELEKELSFNENVQPACLWHSLSTDNLGTKASVSGWGTTKMGAEEVTTELQVGDLDIIDSNICNELLQPLCNRHWCGLQEHQMCSGKLQGGVDTCQGDSGGPLQIPIKLPEYIEHKMYYLLGVTSFGFGCGLPNQPGVYSRIASFVDWIEGIVWPEEIVSQ